jgi:glycerophosphoryl diester phosphodiesterase
MHAKTVAIVAHRGASADAPENTLAAFNLAWAQGADAVECDVQLSKDGRIVVIHDSDTKRVAGKDVPVKDQTLAELHRLDVGSWKNKKWKGEHIPTLADLLSSIPPGRKIFVEIKCSGQNIISEFKSVLSQASELKPEQIIVISGDPSTIAVFRRELPFLKTCLVYGFRQNNQTGAWSPGAERLLKLAKECQTHGLDLYACDGLTPEIAAAIKAAGLQLCVWTVNDEALALKMIALGADTITTDRPAWIGSKVNRRWGH